MPGMRGRTESGSTPERAERRKQFEHEALQYLDALYSFALKLTHELADAEDLVSDAMLLAFERWEQYQPGTKLRAWLFTILYHRFVSRKRGGRAREVDTPRDADGRALYELVGDADPEQRFYDGFLDEGITRAIDALPRDFRIAVVMSDVHGMRYAEIARTLAVPEGTVKSRLFRGRQLLRGMLASYALETGHISFRNCRTAGRELMAS